MSRFQIAVVGCGGMSNTWVQYALERQDAEIVALVDMVETNARAMAERHRLQAGIYTDLNQALAETGANLVFDVTVPSAHEKVCTAAMKAGCDVFGEKPMAATMEEAYSILQTARDTGRSHAVMQNRRYIRTIRAFRELVQGGAIGQPGYIGADFFLGPHFGGFRELMDSPLILDMAIHTFDQARFILGADPVSVYCHEFNPPGSWYKGNASAICIFEMTDGSVFCYRGSWCAEGASTSWEADWRVMGSKGTAIWNGTDAPYAEVIAAVEQEGRFTREYERIEGELTWAGREGHTGCLDEMFAALIEGHKAETDSTDNIQSIAMVLGAIESAKTGQKVDLRNYGTK